MPMDITFYGHITNQLHQFACTVQLDGIQSMQFHEFFCFFIYSSSIINKMYRNGNGVVVELKSILHHDVLGAHSREEKNLSRSKLHSNAELLLKSWVGKIIRNLIFWSKMELIIFGCAICFFFIWADAAQWHASTYNSFRTSRTISCGLLVVNVNSAAHTTSICICTNANESNSRVLSKCNMAEAVVIVCCRRCQNGYKWAAVIIQGCIAT